jgi:hypothetical protein
MRPKFALYKAFRQIVTSRRAYDLVISFKISRFYLYYKYRRKGNRKERFKALLGQVLAAFYRY